MRRFDYTSGSAAKFWQVDRAGAIVTVEYGRIGMQGRSQVKEFGSDAEATAHVDRLIAEKLRKGYVESASATGTPAAPAASASIAAPAVSATVGEPAEASGASSVAATGAPLPDEETFVVPVGWRRSLVPRRGGAPGPALPTGAKARRAGEELLESLRDGIDRLIGNGGDPEVVDALRAWRAGDRTPLGAGALVVAVTHEIGWRDTDRARTLGDLLVATDGVVGAACGLVESARLSARDSWAGRTCVLTLTEGDRADWDYREGRVAVLRRVRAHLAVATDEEYAAARAALADYRDAALPVRVVTSFLLPTETAWLAQDVTDVDRVAEPPLAELMMLSADTAERFARMAGHLAFWSVMHDPASVTAGAATVGPALAPLLAEWFDEEYLDAAGRQRLVALLAAFPTDEAMRLLLDRLDRKYVQAAVLDMLRRFPVRGVRLLADAAQGRTAAAREAATLLRGHVMTNPAAVEAALPLLDEAHRQRVGQVRAEQASAVASADSDRLPPVLVSPPWLVKRQRTAPPVVPGLARPDEAAIQWLPGEREWWAATENPYLAYWRRGEDLADLAPQVAAGTLRDHEAIAFFTRAPEELVRPLLPSWRPDDTWSAQYWARRLVGRHELAALPTALHVARSAPQSAGDVLLPYAASEVADLMADWLDRLKSARPAALAWFRRHPATAARALLPAALGEPGLARRAAERALRLVAIDDRELVLAVARSCGEAAATATVAVLDADPLDQLPARIPALPQWLDPVLLPPVLLRDRSAALPADALRHLYTMLAISKPGEVYPGVALVREACDPASLAEFGWALFERWQAAGAPAKESWVLAALGWIGDDSTARRLAPVIRAWPGEGGHARAVTGLDVLATIGTDVALMHLYGISQKVKFRGLRERAAQKVTEVATELGLDADQLGDRLVPDLGLDADGSLVLDYGPRRFTVGFDEQLKPYVMDGPGTRRKDLPKPGTRDDQALAPEAYQRFVGLKKDVRTLAADQIRRFEAAMVAQRRWAAADFRRYFLAHPLLWHIVRRLVWATFDDTGAPGTAFRVAEDRSLADVEDEAYVLPDDARVGIAHPLHLGADLPAWAELFADYEILQPFAQLGREVHRFDDTERDERLLSRYAGVAVPTGRLLGLERRGWRRSGAQDNGVQPWLERELPGNRAIVVNIDPGITVGMVDMFPDQKIEDVWVNDRPEGDWYPRGGKVRFGDLDEVTASEILRDLAEVVR
ncbi:DUF4132 domain-containing protein [Micromonospora sp. NPDC047548]|uniref:DUF4132 domain-containing protein n=1 Tax=Micromonospora sp. NPDC047548 TaxID=3155624 RepID=UPI0033EE6072